MDRKSISSNISHLPSRKEACPNSPYLSFIQELKAAPARELSLVLDCERFAELAKSPLGMVDDLGKEIQLWSSAIGGRSIRSIYLFHPYRYLEPFELTRVLHDIASHFHVKDRKARKYTVVSEAEEVSSERLALIKGLGFNVYQIIITLEQLSDPKFLSKKISLIRDYAIGSVGLQLSHTDCLNEIRRAIKRIESDVAPDYVCIGNTWDSFDIVSSSKSFPINLNERDLIDEKNLDVLELGPESTSCISDEKIQSYCAPEKYRASLDVDRLPIHVQMLRGSKSTV